MKGWKNTEIGWYTESFSIYLVIMLPENVPISSSENVSGSLKMQEKREVDKAIDRIRQISSDSIGARIAEFALQKDEDEVFYA